MSLTNLYKSQQNPASEILTLVSSDRHSLLIEGPSGSGKTFLAKYFADLKGIADFQLVAPKVEDIKSAVDNCMKTNSPVVLCIENLDTGVKGASYSLLKFLEEPMSYVYIVVTCRNINRVPDTIISRSSVVTLGLPIEEDLCHYASLLYPNTFSKISGSKLWKCCRTFSDVDTVCKMSQDDLSYFNELDKLLSFNDSVSNIVWTLGHFQDNRETPINIVIQYIMNNTLIPHIRKCGIECLNDINSGRIAKHTVLTKFAFECKYVE